MSRHYDVMTSHERNPFSLSQSSVAQLLSNNSALANYATCRVSVITSYQDVSRLIVRNTNRIDINDLQTLCSTHLTSNPSPPSRTRRLSRTTGKLRWVLRLCKLRAVPSLQPFLWHFSNLVHYKIAYKLDLILSSNIIRFQHLSGWACKGGLVTLAWPSWPLNFNAAILIKIVLLPIAIPGDQGILTE